jgi:hypothetical protein
MRKSVKILEIYRELRYATAGTASAIDLIRLAHLILKSYNFEDDSSFKFQDQVKLREISFLPLDEALSDGERWPRSFGQFGGFVKLVPVHCYAASAVIDTLSGACPGEGVGTI